MLVADPVMSLDVDGTASKDDQRPRIVCIGEHQHDRALGEGATDGLEALEVLEMRMARTECDDRTGVITNNTRGSLHTRCLPPAVGALETLAGDLVNERRQRASGGDVVSVANLVDINEVRAEGGGK